MASSSSSASEPSGKTHALFVKLVSQDKRVFILEKRVAMVSGMIRTMLASDAFKEGREDGEINFPDISSQVLEKVIEYFHYKFIFNNSKVPIPEFVISPEQALDVLIAASYMDC